MKVLSRSSSAPREGPSAAAIEHVLRRPELARPVFQPIADLRRATVAGYEALIRFSGAPAGTPDRWFAAAVEAGLGPELEALVIRSVLAARGRLPRNCFLSINVSPALLCSREVRAALFGAGSLAGIVIEITEHSHEESALVLPVASELRDAGAMLAVDDVGSGYASLAQVLRLRPEFVKVDRDLIALIDGDEGRGAAVEMLGTLASDIDAWLIAEGVERFEEVDALMRMRVPLGQGFALGPPLPEWSGLTARAARYIRDRRVHDSRERSVGALMETAPALDVEGGAEAAASLLRTDPRLTIVVLVDRSGRAVALVRNTSPPRPVTLAVSPSSRLREVVRRALGRSEHERFQPLVCCDEEGRFLGLVRFERLVQALVAGPAPPLPGA